MNATIRNIVIVLALAALVVAVPGGGTGAHVALQAVSLVFIATLGWFTMIMYRQHRVSLYSLGDSKRFALYASVGALLIVFSALYRVSGAGALMLVLVAVAAVWTIATIVWSAREY